MKKGITLQDIECRLAALETAVAYLTAQRNNRKIMSDEPRGRFAHLGGIERLPARSFERPENPLESSHYSIAGKLVGQHLTETPDNISFDHLGGKRVGGHIAQPDEPDALLKKKAPRL